MLKSKAATRACTPGSGGNFESDSTKDQNGAVRGKRYRKANSLATSIYFVDRFLIVHKKPPYPYPLIARPRGRFTEMMVVRS